MKAEELLELSDEELYERLGKYISEGKPIVTDEKQFCKVFKCESSEEFFRQLHEEAEEYGKD